MLHVGKLNYRDEHLGRIAFCSWAVIMSYDKTIRYTKGYYITGNWNIAAIKSLVN